MKWGPLWLPAMRESLEANNFLVPMVVEQTGRGDRGYDIYSPLLVTRIVLLGTPLAPPCPHLVIPPLLVPPDPRPGALRHVD